MRRYIPLADTAIFDVDGTLIDTNYQHALAFYRAFRRYDITLPIWRLHRATGMGGDQLVAHVAGDEVERRYGSAVREAWVEEFDKMIDEVRPFDGARELMETVKSRGFRVVLASSGKAKHVDHFLDLIEGRSIADAWTTADDVESSKPEPDLVATALDKVEGASGVMIGDSTWDCVAAGKLGVPSLAVRTGGFSVEELTDAGAERVFESLRELAENLDDTPLARPER
jgi:HAD superfamily hydrolase (TIGR01549 family)